MPICDQCNKDVADLDRHKKSHEATSIKKTFDKGESLSE